MGCCGQKRTALKPAQTPARRTPPLGTMAAPATAQPPPPAPVAAAPGPARAAHVAPAPARPAHGEVWIRYSELSAVRVRGTATGRVYEFSAAAPAQAVDRRDAPALLASGFFRSTI
jgi:hypothetical protein